MNEIENLIAGLPCPSPSPNLDARIAQLTTRPARAGAIRARLRRLGVLAACTACAGMVGFALGRQSASAVAGNQPVAPLPANPMPPVATPTDRAIVKLELPQSEALARFVMPPRRTEGLFGRGPLEERSGSSPLE